MDGPTGGSHDRPHARARSGAARRATGGAGAPQPLTRSAQYCRRSHRRRSSRTQTARCCRMTTSPDPTATTITTARTVRAPSTRPLDSRPCPRHAGSGPYLPEWDTHWRHNGHSVKDREAPLEHRRCSQERSSLSSTPQSTSWRHSHSRRGRLSPGWSHRTSRRNLVGIPILAAGVGTILWSAASHATTWRRARLARASRSISVRPAHTRIPRHRRPLPVLRETRCTSATCLMWAGWAVLLGSPAVALGLAVLCLGLQAGVRLEERGSARQFGSQWKGYASAVPRFIGRRA